MSEALSQSIVVVGLNAALQKRFVLAPGKNLEPGNVHRAHRCETGVGGKGQDVGVALSCLLSRRAKEASNDDKAVLLAQFLGAGPEGDAVSNALRTKHGLSDALTIRNAAPLRTCTTIVGADEATELVETSGEVTDEEMEALRGKIEEMTKEGGRADCVCIMGSMPPGCEGGTYADLTSRLAGGESLVLIDSVIGLDPLLAALAAIYDENEGTKEGGGGAVLKLNAAELCKLAGVTKPSGETDRVTMEELTASTKGFVSTHASAIGALDYLCITDGKWPGYLVEVPRSASASFRTWQLPAVDLSKEGMLYPIGAGDTVAAGTLAAWQYLHHRTKDQLFGVVPSEVGTKLSERRAQWSEEEDKGGKMATAFAFGLACGSASCLQQENSVFDVDDAVKFFGGMAKPIVQ
eukprot:CAMPEP_0172551702 /NCGR_PEP_ID=MMETSP1067-20121228/40156_1 /TAXON_ID=265564 ORGANISM="Thalassiosira punctigera, Strain Tpunct2005C2" /NCGR_SAMPLE_ID=MMETSP1067 /ASSEMBLY_ACC=CAM_ASM_000444 /LENGTH=406 /DNA_ID=CAMNT_0013339515 /DNA_START=165 /DNA_END=1385 /DNA_ORIENTATION=+